MKTKNCFDCILELNSKDKTDKEAKKIEKEMEESDKIDCQSFPWIINRKLSKTQVVCDTKINGELENVQVLTPCDHKALISKEAYDKEKSGENYWRSS
jgi:hypothetical protein